MTARLAFVYNSREMLWEGIYPCLRAESGVIRDTLIQCEGLIEARLGWSLTRTLSVPGPVPQEVVDPIATAVQLALTRAWQQRGIRPDAIVARSGGEFAAEYSRGTLTLDNAFEVACRWARLQHERRGSGTMLRIETGLAQAIRLQQISPVPFFIAADLLSGSTIVSCAASAAAGVDEFLARHGVRCIPTRFTFAPHSPLIDSWKSAFVEPAVETRADAAGIPYYSAGAQVPDRDTSYATRMWQSVRSPALMRRTLRRLVEDGYNVLLEIGGRPMLRGQDEKVSILPTMREGQPLGPVMDATQATLARLGIVARPPQDQASK